MHVLENAILVQKIVKYIALTSKVRLWSREGRFITESDIN